MGSFQLSTRMVYAPLTRCRALGTIPQVLLSTLDKNTQRIGIGMLQAAFGAYCTCTMVCMYSQTCVWLPHSRRRPSTTRSGRSRAVSSSARGQSSVPTATGVLSARGSKLSVWFATHCGGALVQHVDTACAELRVSLLKASVPCAGTQTRPASTHRSMLRPGSPSCRRCTTRAAPSSCSCGTSAVCRTKASLAGPQPLCAVHSDRSMKLCTPPLH
jgi:hypothetical protein